MSTELNKTPKKMKSFLDKYLADIDILSTHEVDAVCKFTEWNKDILVESIIRSLAKDTSVISLNSNYILQNVDLISCLIDNSKLFTKLQQSIVSIENISKRDMAAVMEILKKVCEKSTSLPNFTPSNIFHCFRDIKNCDNVEEIISYIAYDLKDSNFFILIDSIVAWSLENPTYKIADYESVITKITNIRSELGWDRLPYQYLMSLYNSRSDESLLQGLKSYESFISNLTTKEGYLTLYSPKLKYDEVFHNQDVETLHILKADKTAVCAQNGTCGIRVSILGTGPSFDIQIFAQQKRLKLDNEIVHFHGELKSSSVHICLRWKSVMLPLSWYGKPEYDAENDVWKWGANLFCALDDERTFPNSRIKFTNNLILGRDVPVELVAFVKL